ncbi:MAG TPA: hypothetical protein PLO41_03320 [Rubrivivax sp.]|nr:hypothetical protein [Rubrivivax sp.]
MLKLLTRRGVLVEEMGRIFLAEPDADGDEARTLRPLQAAAITYRIAFGPRAGHGWCRKGRCSQTRQAIAQPLPIAQSSMPGPRRAASAGSGCSAAELSPPACPHRLTSAGGK